MTEALGLSAAVIIGMALGAFFFGGLWWTIRKAMSFKRAGLWFLGSMLLRIGIVLLGFYSILGDSWQKLLAGLLGFVIARIMMVRIYGVKEPTSASVEKAGHAP